MDVEGAAVTTALMVHLDREAVVLPSGERSTMRRFEAPAGEALPQLLVRCGVPLQFVDGRGLWLVFAGRADAAGDLLAVVRQIPGKDAHGSGAEVLFAVDRAPAELAVGSDLYLFYRSTSGPEDDVVAAAAQGRAGSPPRPRWWTTQPCARPWLPSPQSRDRAPWWTCSVRRWGASCWWT